MRRVLAGLVVALLLVACRGQEEAADKGATTQTTETTEPRTTSPVPLVLASREGVVVIPGEDDEATQISSAPAAVAYGIGADLVVFQDGQREQHIYPPRADGPVRVWSDGKVRDLAAHPEATGAELLDARLVDRVPVGLIAERFGGVGPDDTFEQLVRIDLRDDSRTTFVRRPAWESAHAAARLLPGGDVAGLFHSEALVLLARWSPGAQEALWTVEVGADTHVDLTRHDGVIAIVESAFDTERDLAPAVTVTTRDPATGKPGPSETTDLADPDDRIGTGLFCRDWIAPAQLACGRSDGGPVAISLDEGSFTPLPGAPGAIPTVIHSN